MCGIVGIASKNDCIDNIISGLYSLEYRGYDSSGLATIKNNHFEYNKNIGKISNLEKSVKNNKLSGDVVIAHTRWATHGKPSIKNCHPFIKDNCVLVHNGIIENYTDLINFNPIPITHLFIHAIYQTVQCLKILILQTVQTLQITRLRLI